MDLVLVRLTAADNTADSGHNPELITDILWAAARLPEGLEHIRARHGPSSATFDVAMFYSSGSPSIAEAALDLCERAIASAPALLGWSADLIPTATDYPTDPGTTDLPMN